MNAKKGDIVLSPGDGSLIARALAAVDPPEAYSHSGMMTRNRDEITHSTASQARLTDSAYVDQDGFRPDILKYLWPGAITQTVKHAVEGEDMVDPESGNSYTVGGFGSLQAYSDPWGSTPLAVAMVVKPNPLNETSAIRTQLHSIADFASNQVGKSHYSFFCYTDPTVGLNQKAPDEAKWAAGTFPTMCASLVWMSIRQSGAQMARPLDQSDIEAGAQIAADTPDGLFLYQADERLNAGEVLYSNVGNLALQEAGKWAAFITDIQEDLGNQVLNTFGSDWSDTDATESDKWRQASDANSISPQDFLFYHPPLYGYAEPLIYRGERWEQVTIYRWKLVPQTGTISGIVRYKGEPAAGADIQITESLATHSDANGGFRLDGVPVGSVIVGAQKVMGTGLSGVLTSAQATVNVSANQTTILALTLTPPSHTFRRILINGGLKTINYEWDAAVNPQNYSEFNGIVDLDPQDATHMTKTFDCVADDDTLGRLYLTFDLQANDSVTVKTMIRCYDSNTDDTDDYDEASLDPFILHAGKHSSWSIVVDGQNYAWACFDLMNETNPS
jgi:hypothetical protein